MKEIEICAHLQVPKNKLSRCRSEAWGWCRSAAHKVKTWFCHEHLVQCEVCGGVYCLQCLEKHREECKAA